MERTREYRTRFTLGTGLTGASLRQPELMWSHAGSRPKDTSQMALVGEPGVRRDIGQRIFARQRTHCILNSESSYILPHRHAVAVPEGAGQMNGMCSDALGDGRQAERPAEFSMQDFDYVLQPMRGTQSGLSRMLPGKLVQQFDGRGFQQQAGPVVRVRKGLVRPPRQP